MWSNVGSSLGRRGTKRGAPLRIPCRGRRWVAPRLARARLAQAGVGRSEPPMTASAWFTCRVAAMSCHDAARLRPTPRPPSPAGPPRGFRDAASEQTLLPLGTERSTKPSPRAWSTLPPRLAPGPMTATYHGVHVVTAVGLPGVRELDLRRWHVSRGRRASFAAIANGPGGTGLHRGHTSSRRLAAVPLGGQSIGGAGWAGPLVPSLTSTSARDWSARIGRGRTRALLGPPPAPPGAGAFG